MRAKVVTLLALWAAFPAIADEADAKLSVSMLVKWQCSTWAGMMGDSEVSERLYLSGFEDAKAFVKAVYADKISREDALSHVPMIVLSNLQGPNEDFVSGRIFQAIHTDAYERIAKKSPDGLPLPLKDWITQQDLLASRAQTQFHTANCRVF